MSDSTTVGILGLTAQIVSAHVGKNQVSVKALPSLIEAVYRSLSQATAETMEAEPVRLTPAVPVKKSVFPDYIVCLEDGKKLKMLKRHLRTTYNLLPDEYRTKWGLPKDYPMVAPSYASHRSSLAKEIGLGRKQAVEPEATVAEPVMTKVPARRAKGSKGK